MLCNCNCTWESPDLLVLLVALLPWVGWLLCCRSHGCSQPWPRSAVGTPTTSSVMRSCSLIATTRRMARRSRRRRPGRAIGLTSCRSRRQSATAPARPRLRARAGRTTAAPRRRRDGTATLRRSRRPPLRRAAAAPRPRRALRRCSSVSSTATPRASPWREPAPR